MQTERTIRLRTRLPEIDPKKDTIPKPDGLGVRSPHKARSVQCVFTECSVLVRSLFNTAEGAIGSGRKRC
jgi:hypothetical protein